MIGGRIFDDTVLVGFALGRSVYVLAVGKPACPGMHCAAEGDSWLRAATRRPEPLRAAAAVGAYARDPMLGAIPRRHPSTGSVGAAT